MRSVKMESRVLLVAFCCLTLGSLSEGIHGKHIPNVLVMGKLDKASHFVQGASVVLECGDGMSSKHMVRRKAILNEHGEFQIHMPASFSKHHSTIKACSVKLMSSTESECAVASTITTTLVHLNSRKVKGLLHVFSAGLLTLNPLKNSSLCGQKQNLEAHTDEEFTSMKNTIRTAELTQPFFPHLPSFGPELTPSLPRLPQLPQLPPLPVLPSLPTLPKQQLTTPKPAEEINQKLNVIDQKVVPSTFPFPFPPNPLQPPSLRIPLPPNPLLPPPSIFPPVPGLTPPPSGILPPLPGLTPPPPPGIIPPIPGLTPPQPPASILPPLPGIPTLPGVPGFPGFASPPPPPPPSLLPPFLFPPGFPGIPPVVSKSTGQP